MNTHIPAAVVVTQWRQCWRGGFSATVGFFDKYFYHHVVEKQRKNPILDKPAYRDALGRLAT